MNQAANLKKMSGQSAEGFLRLTLKGQQSVTIDGSDTSMAVLVISGAALVGASDVTLMATGQAIVAKKYEMIRLKAVRACELALIQVEGQDGAVRRSFRVSPLLAAMIAHDDPAFRDHARCLFEGELNRASAIPYDVRMPSDARALRVAQVIVDDPADTRSLTDFAECFGASRRTLLRLFVAQTGMSFRQFRRHVRICRSLAMLAEGTSIQDASLAVGYESTSAFIAAFRSVTGTTPGAWLRGYLPVP